MPHIRLQNGARVWVQAPGIGYVSERSFSELLADLGSYSSTNKIAAINTVSQLGVLAKDAIPALEGIVYANGDINVIRAALDALDKVSPEKYGNYEVRSSVLEHRRSQISSNATITTKPTTTSKTMTTDVKKQPQKVDIVQMEADLDQEVCVTRKCNFCEKETVVAPGTKKITEHLCSPGKFYCNFCLRHNFNTKDNRHVLITTFRGIFGYYYYEFYQFPKYPQMWLSEITDYISLHEQAGLRNPVFNYDPESYCWFIDFRRVGSTKKKIRMEDVCSTVIDILAAFNLPIHVNGLQLHRLYAKYQEAVKDFYEKRYRPEGRRLCAPTLKGCGNVNWGGTSALTWHPSTQNQIKMNLEDTKMFQPIMLDPSKYWKKTSSL